MAKLGTLYYDIQFKDQTDKVIADIKKKVDALNTKGIKLRIDPRGAEKSLKDLRKELEGTKADAQGLRGMLAEVFSIAAIRGFLDNLIQVGGEIEKQKIAMEAMTGSIGRAGQLIGQLKGLSLESPFTFGQLTAYTKQLSTYGLQYRDLYDTTKRLADISAGVGVDMSRVVLAYGQVFTAQFLRGPELRQFTEAGIPMVEKLAERFTKLRGEVVSSGDVFEMITKRMVKFEDVKAVIDEMTGEGGKFEGMQEKLSASLAGQWAILKGQVELMYSEIADGNSSLLKGSIGILQELVKHWRAIGSVVTAAGTAYLLMAARHQIASRVAKAAMAQDVRAVTLTWQRVTGINEETKAYNRLAEAMRRATSSTATPGAVNALRVAATRAALSGASKESIMSRVPAQLFKDPETEFWTGSVAKAHDLRASLQSQQKELKNTAGLFGKLGKGAKIAGTQIQMGLMRASLALRSFRTALAGLFSWTNVIFLAIGGLVSAWADARQRAEEMETKAQEANESAAQSYKELRELVTNNPIEATIQTGDDDQIAKLRDKYMQAAQESPIDLGFAITHAEAVTDAVEQLRILEKAIKDAAEAAQEATKQDYGHQAADIVEETTSGFWFWEKNLKTEFDGLSEARKDLKSWADTRTPKMFQEFLNFLGSTDSFSDKATKKLRSLREEVLALQKTGKAVNINDTYLRAVGIIGSEPYDDIKKSNTGGFRSYIGKYHDILEDELEDLGDKMRETAGRVNQYAFSSGINIRQLDDSGYTKIMNISEAVVKQLGLTEDESRQYLAYMESTWSPAMGATWADAGKATELFAKEYLSVFPELKGKTAQELEDAWRSGTNNAVKQSISDALRRFGQEAPWMIGRMQQILNNNPLTVFIKLAGAQQDERTLLQKEFDERFGKAGVRSPEFDRLSPQGGEKALTWNRRVAEQHSKTLKEIATLNGMNSEQAKKELEDAEKMREAEEAVMNRYAIKAEGSKKGSGRTGAKTDEELKRLQAAYDSLKKYMQAFEKLRDLYGDVAAMEKLAASGQFEAGRLPEGVTGRAGLLVWMEAQLRELQKQAGARTEERKRLTNQIADTLAEQAFDTDKELFDNDLKALERTMKLQKAAWERMEKLVGEGVSREDAMRYALGSSGETKRWADYAEQQLRLKLGADIDVSEVADMDEGQVKELFGHDARKWEPVWRWLEEFREARRALESEHDKLYAELYGEAKTYEDKIADIDAKEKRRLAMIGERERAYAEAQKQLAQARAAGDTAGVEKAKRALVGGVDPERAKRMRYAATARAGRERGEVQMEMFRSSLPYLNYFNAVLAMTKEEALRVGEALRESLSKRVQEGTISMKDYLDELEKINGQGEKLIGRKYGSEKQARRRGGLTAATDWKIEQTANERAAAGNELLALEKEREELEKSGKADTPIGVAWKASIDARTADAMERLRAATIANTKAQEEKTAKEKAADVVNMIAGGTQGLSNFRDSLGGMLDSFGFDTEGSDGWQTFSTVVDSISALGSGVQSAFQKIMSGDFIGAAFDVITTPLNIIAAFNKLHDKRNQNIIEKLQENRDALAAAADRIAASVEAALSLNGAKERALRQNEQLSAQMSNLGAPLGTDYQYAYKLLSGEMSGADLIEKMYEVGGENLEHLQDKLDAYASYGLDTSKGIDQFKGQISYGNMKGAEEAAAALKAQGFDKAESISAYGAQYASLVEQRRLLEQEIGREADNKDADKDKLKEKREELAEMNQEIADFAENVAKELYGIDLKGWAQQFGNALVQAFRNGEDAAQAFQKTANDILAQLAANMLIQSMLAPIFEEMGKVLFGDGTNPGVFDINDPEGTMDAALGVITEYMGKAEDRVPYMMEMLETINEKTDGALKDASGSSSSSTISATSMTEETATLLASYINAIRADVSVNRGYMQKIVEESLPRLSVVAESQLAQLNAIARHTELIEQNTAANLAVVREIGDGLRSVITPGSGGKAIRIK